MVNSTCLGCLAHVNAENFPKGFVTTVVAILWQTGERHGIKHPRARVIVGISSPASKAVDDPMIRAADTVVRTLKRIAITLELCRNGETYRFRTEDFATYFPGK